MNDSISNNASSTQPAKPKRPLKALPSGRTKFTKQVEVLLAYAIASTHEKKPVTVQDVADISQMHPNTISLCNPFFVECGLLSKQGHSFTPAPEVFEYSSRNEWDDEYSGRKLSTVLKGTWFSTALLPRITLRPLLEEEVIAILADISGASPDYRNQLAMLIDYLEFSGLVERESGSVKLGPTASHKNPDKKPKDGTGKNEPENSTNVNTKQVMIDFEDNGVGVNKFDSFEIPIPGHQLSARFQIPKDLDHLDWEMLKQMLDAYINRLQKRSSQKTIENIRGCDKT